MASLSETCKIRSDSASFGHSTLDCIAQPLQDSGVAGGEHAMAVDMDDMKAPKQKDDQCATIHELVADSEPCERYEVYYDPRLTKTSFCGKVPIGYAYIVVHHKVSKFADLVGNITVPGKRGIAYCSGEDCPKCESSEQR